VNVVSTRVDLAAARLVLPAPVGLVPTLGALHAGHATLIDTARAQCDSVVVSVFVNPTQFGPSEDLSRYPRTLEADVDLCRKHGANLVWAPDVADVYTVGEPQVTIHPGPLGAQLEGASRPTHFAGMLTVVEKLLSTVRPDAAYFGEKDYQQLTLIRRMVADLDLGTEIIAVPTVRDPDGLALSSRNVYLSASERHDALALSRALFAGRDAAAGGAHAVLAAAQAVLDAHPDVTVDYLALRGADLGDVPASGSARLLVATRVGTTRLVDNVAIDNVARPGAGRVAPASPANSTPS
jgi:pantoate--beta-alanine ligase